MTFIYIHCIYSNNKNPSYLILKRKEFTCACAGIHLVLVIYRFLFPYYLDLIVILWFLFPYYYYYLFFFLLDNLKTVGWIILKFSGMVGIDLDSIGSKSQVVGLLLVGDMVKILISLSSVFFFAKTAQDSELKFSAIVVWSYLRSC